MASENARPNANVVDDSPRKPSRCVIHVSSGVAKTRIAITVVASTHSSEYSSDSRRLRTRSSTKRASSTAPSAVINWVRERNILGLLDGFADERHERRQQVLVGVVELLAERVERRAGLPLAHDHRDLVQPEPAARERDEERSVGEIPGEVVLADLHDPAVIGAEAGGGVRDGAPER